VNWDDAKSYVAWISKRTGKPYRLLTEAEYEYATRARTQTVYPWGNEIGKSNANCNGCGSEWDLKQTAPVGSFAPNQFGLYDMVGNVRERVEDCYHDIYNGAADRRFGLDNRRLQSPCGPRRFLGQRSLGPPLGLPHRGHRRLPGRRSGFPGWEDAYALMFSAHAALFGAKAKWRFAELRLWSLRLDCQIAHHALEALLVGVMILPAREVADVPCTSKLRSPRLVRRFNLIIQADRKQHDLPALLFLFESLVYLILDPVLRIECLDKTNMTLSRNRIAASISSRILPPIGMSCGANQQRTPLFWRSAWMRLANPSSIAE
jgi:hypothetical protein